MAAIMGIVLTFFFAVVASAAPQKTAIRDILYRADGALFEGTAQIEWKAFRAADGTEIPQNRINLRISRGSVSVDLVPSTNAIQSVYYTVRFDAEGRGTTVEYWSVPPAAASLRLKDVRTHAVQSGPLTTAPTLVPMQSVSGLRTELDLRPQRGATWMSGRVAVIGQSGGLESALGDADSCLRIDGTTTPCGFAGITYIDNEVPRGEINGTNAVFQLSRAPIPMTSLTLHRNGALLRQNVEYVLSGSAVTFLPGNLPGSGDSLLASYRVNAESGLVYVDLESPAGPINGVNRQYRLSSAPTPASSLHFYRNGLLQKQGVDYELSVDTVTFIPAATPGIGDTLAASYRK